MYTYDKALRESYYLPAAAIAAGGVLGSFVGPKGKVGRVANVSYVLTTAATVADSVLTVGPNGAATPVSLTVPFTGSAIGANDATTSADLYGQVELAADTVVEVASDGGSTAGVGNIVVTVDWY
jgi:hypothetical protein